MTTISALQRAISRKCVDCCGGHRVEVAACVLSQCPLWPFRASRATTAAKDISESKKPSREAGRGGKMARGSLLAVH